MSNSKCCRVAMATAAAFIAIFAFDWLYHGVVLMPIYEATASLWRPMAEMEGMMLWCILRHAMEAVILAWIFSRNYEGRGPIEGVRFGIYVGALLGVVHAGMYIYLPIPGSLAIYWFNGELLRGVLAGVAMAMVYSCACKKDRANT